MGAIAGFSPLDLPLPVLPGPSWLSTGLGGSRGKIQSGHGHIHIGYGLFPTGEENNYCSLNFSNLCDHVVKKLVSEIGNVVPLTLLTSIFAGTDMLTRSPCSLNSPNLNDNFIKKLVSEIKNVVSWLRGAHYMLAQTCSHGGKAALRPFCHRLS